MAAREKKIVLKEISRPAKEDANAIAEMICKAFDFSDKDDIVPLLFRKIAESSVKGEGVTSKELSQKLRLPRSTVLYKLNYFIDTGIVVRSGRYYFLRGDSLETTLEQIQAEMEMEFSRLLKFASKFDELLQSEVYGRKRKQQ
jgi:hypothetical protein